MKPIQLIEPTTQTFEPVYQEWKGIAGEQQLERSNK